MNFSKDLTLEECKQYLQEFANNHKLIFDDEGECGFGRDCVGIRSGNNWVDYNPTCYPDHDYVKNLYDERLYDMAAPNAYHKHNCLCVLGRGEHAIKELTNWIYAINQFKPSIETYSTGATGMQAMLTGMHGTAIKLNK